jgi:peptide/nickel transport system substrate-binding protein
MNRGLAGRLVAAANRLIVTLPLAVLLFIAVSLTPPGARAADRVTIGMQLEPPILDPTANPAAAISEVLYGNVFEGLVRFAADGSAVPKLAAYSNKSACLLPTRCATRTNSPEVSGSVSR